MASSAGHEPAREITIIKVSNPFPSTSQASSSTVRSPLRFSLPPFPPRGLTTSQIYIHAFFFRTLVLSSFWTNKPWSQVGVVPSSPPVLAFIFLSRTGFQQSHCSSIFFVEWVLLLIHALSRAFRKSICTQEKVPTTLYEYTEISCIDKLCVKSRPEWSQRCFAIIIGAPCTRLSALGTLHSYTRYVSLYTSIITYFVTRSPPDRPVVS